MNRKKILIIAGVIIIAVAGVTALIKTSALNKETTEVSTEIEEITPEPTEEPAPTPDPTPEPTPEATEEAEELEYIEEAKELWQEHKEEFICNDETFRGAYIAERASGSDKEEAYKAVYEEFKVEEAAEEEEGEQKEETKESEGQKEETTEQTTGKTEQTPAPTEAPQQTSQSEPSSQDSGLDPSDPSSLSRLLGTDNYNFSDMTPGTGDGHGSGATTPGE